LKTVAPVYGVIGLGMMLYFASQGAKRVLWPVLAGTMRMIVATLGGWFVVAGLEAGLAALFWTIAVASILFGGITAGSVSAGVWGRPGTVDRERQRR
jgi:Na+-driven multidrug efflux pump